MVFFQVQKLLGYCTQHLDKGEVHQGPAVLGIALVSMAEELGLEMSIRSLEHLLQYGEQNIRRAVPLALGILCISNPKVLFIFTLIHINLSIVIYTCHSKTRLKKTILIKTAICASYYQWHSYFLPVTNAFQI